MCVCVWHQSHTLAHIQLLITNLNHLTHTFVQTPIWIQQDEDKHTHTSGRWRQQQQLMCEYLHCSGVEHRLGSECSNNMRSGAHLTSVTHTHSLSPPPANPFSLWSVTLSDCVMAMHWGIHLNLMLSLLHSSFHPSALPSLYSSPQFPLLLLLPCRRGWCPPPHFLTLTRRDATTVEVQTAVSEHTPRPSQTRSTHLLHFGEYFKIKLMSCSLSAGRMFQGGLSCQEQVVTRILITFQQLRMHWTDSVPPNVPSWLTVAIVTWSPKA